MYGFVNHALELLVLRNFGEETWERIKEEAACELEGHFVTRCIYEDKVTYDLVAAASKVLEIDAGAILELFGQFFFEFTEESGYNTILQVLGSSTREFLENLDALHDHLATIYPGMRAPSFRCTEKDGSVILHYYSDREGLEPIVMGLVKTVAQRLHNTEVDVRVIQEKSLPDSDHVQFEIKNKRADGGRLVAESDEDDQDEMGFETEPLISPESFCSAFPFHIMFDREMCIHQMGTSLARLLNFGVDEDALLTDFFEMIRPHGQLSFQAILSHINTIYVLRMKPRAASECPSRRSSDVSISPYDFGTAPLDFSSEVATVRLKGQMVHVAESDLILFLCSPNVTNLDDMARNGLYLSDIPLHDATRDLLLLSEKFSQEYELAKDLEILTDKLQYTYRLLEDEKKKTDRLLYSVLPPSVANELRHNRPVNPRKYESATIMFSGIAGFTSICAKYAGEPMRIVDLLNDIYVRFDKLTDKAVNPKVYKVETIGDKYMVVSGVPDPLEDHARCICQLALDMMEVNEERERMLEEDGIHITITIGIHTGEVVSGVIGNRVPRYCLFGNTVNLASRTETTGITGRVNVSETTYYALTGQKDLDVSECQLPQIKDPDFEFEFRGEIAMKGKATPMKCWMINKPKA